MKRTYAINYKSKSKIIKTAEKIAETEEKIKEESSIIDAKISEDGLAVTVEVEEIQDFVPAMNWVVNVFRKIDDKSEVAYKFELNRN